MKKKTILLFALIAVFAFSAFGASASELNNYYPREDSYEITVNVGAENAESMYGLVAIKGTGTDLNLADTGTIVYIDQAKADANGNITFAKFAPMGPAPSAILPSGGPETDKTVDDYFAECTVFIGGGHLNTAQAIGILKDGSTLPITGTIVDTASNANSTRVATIKVLDDSDGEVSSTTVANGAYTVNAPAGTNYKVVISKPGFCTYTFTGVNVAEAVDLGTTDISTLAGNANGSEIAGINFDDLSAVLDHYYDETTELYDVNGSGAVNFDDLGIVLDNYYAEHITNNLSE